LDKSKLEKFVQEGFSTHDIAREMGVSQTNICHWLKKYGLKTIRSKSSNPYTKLFVCTHCNKLKPVSRSSFNKYCSAQCQQDYQRSQIDFKDYKRDRTRRLYLIRHRGHQCECCKNTEWNNQSIPLEIDHIDGNHQNNVLENVRLLCPNCHAQTPTYKNRNAGNGRESRRKKNAT
jgi:5-methylcytosine-specific restriction endonuclease McrA